MATAIITLPANHTGKITADSTKIQVMGADPHHINHNNKIRMLQEGHMEDDRCLEVAAEDLSEDLYRER